jgi:hypothetical protein
MKKFAIRHVVHDVEPTIIAGTGRKRKRLTS